MNAVFGLYWYFLLLLVKICHSFKLPKADLCSEDMHAQTQYCQADFVVKALLRGPSNSTTNRVQNGLEPYRITIKTEIKINPAFMNVSDVSLKKIWFSRRPKRLVLKPGEKYIISGRLRTVNGEVALVADACSDWIQPWTEVAHRHRSSLRKSKFERGCDCQIKLKPEKRRSSDECPLPLAKMSHLGLTFSQQDLFRNCYKEHSHCIRKSSLRGGVCSWTNSQELKHCLSNLNQQR